MVEGFEKIALLTTFKNPEHVFLTQGAWCRLSFSIEFQTWFLNSQLFVDIGLPVRGAELAMKLVEDGMDREIKLIASVGSPFWTAQPKTILEEGASFIATTWDWFEKWCPTLLGITRRFASDEKIGKKQVQSLSVCLSLSLSLSVSLCLALSLSLSLSVRN